MKVMFVMPEGMRLGGAEEMLWTILRHSRVAGIEPSVVFLKPGPFPVEAASLGVATFTLSSGRLREARRVARTTRTLAGLLHREQPDVVLSWLQKTHLYVGPAALAAGISDRAFWWQHDIPSGRWIDRLATLVPARAVGASSRSAARAQAKLWPHRQTFVVHPGTEAAARLSSAERARLRDHLEIPTDRFIAGAVARLQPWKGQHHLIRAVAELRNRGHDVGALIVGGDAYRLAPEYGPNLRRLVRDLDIGEFVRFTGHVRDATPYMQVMDAVVNTSAAEPFGIALLEAMSLALPIVAVDAGGPSEFLVSNENAVLVAAPRPEAFSEALERLLSDPSLPIRLGSRAEALFREQYRAERMTLELQAQLSRLRKQLPDAA